MTPKLLFEHPRDAELDILFYFWSNESGVWNSWKEGTLWVHIVGKDVLKKHTW